MCSQPDEKRLIEKARQGDKAALGQLYELYVDAIYRYMLYRTSDHQVAEDITAEVFASMITSIQRYEDWGMPFGAWLFRIARARLADYWRKTKYREQREVAFSPAVEEFLIGEAPEERREHEALTKALGYLTPAEREIILLRFAAGLSNQEISTVVDRNTNAIKSMTHRAFKKLRKIIDRKTVFSESQWDDDTSDE